MSSRDKDGNFVNDKGVTIKISEYNGGVKVDFYDKSPRDPDHKSIHTHINEDKTYSTENNVNDTGEVEKDSGSCYLTTACMNHIGDNFDDNCEELTILRWFRDNFVPKVEIANYYYIAPKVVASINKKENNQAIYEYIYLNIVEPCVAAIKRGDYNFAFNRYRNSVLALEAEFVNNFAKKKE